jgi:hypothetical protein
MNELPLKDIHLPEVSLWWPPAPGWWLLLILVIIIGFFLPGLIRWLRWRPVKTLSLKELAQIRTDMLNGLDQQQVLQQISILLRRTLISYCGRASGASITGKNWVERLSQLAGDDCFSAEQNEWLSRDQYKASAQCDVEAMLGSCENWIRALPRRNPDVAD